MLELASTLFLLRPMHRLQSLKKIFGNDKKVVVEELVSLKTVLFLKKEALIFQLYMENYQRY